MERSRARTGRPQPHNPAAIGIHRTGAAEASAPSRTRLIGARPRDPAFWRNLGGAGLAWFLLIAIALTGYLVVVVPLRAEILNTDFTQAYVAATIGRTHGWSHIYSLDLQRQLLSELRPQLVFNDGAWFTPAPPYAWLVLPLTALSPAAGVYIWLALSAAGLVAAWWLAAPGAGRFRLLWLLGALAWYPVLYGLSLAQPALIVLVVVAAAWRLSEAGRPYLAGVVLGLTVIKPQLILALPLVLLASGKWRALAPWAAIGVVLALLSLLAIGPGGLSDYRAILAHESEMPNNRYFTLAYLLGPGPLSYVGPALVVALAAAGAYFNREAGYARLYALGIVASALAATYWHLQDFTILVLAAWLFWREQPPLWQRLWLLVVIVGGEFAWGITPLPMLIGLGVWFSFLIARPAPNRRAVPVRA
ncbi:MAG: DUF2029 domain-containing protein [Chloroflexi bacterium]|nr:MAG: DUF2029 domain-containing protein [Chloroflexota bacterium]TMF94965.1 MAG: DUF2029 domain-containing protein [Chloroflexota bacterium]